MKRTYWKPRIASRRIVMGIALVSLIGVAAVEAFRTRDYASNYEEKLAAARLAGRAMEVIAQERVARGYEIDLSLDPTGSGLLGAEITPITSIAGSLKAKRTSINPNFAAVVVDMLRRAGVQEGDQIAVGYTGSMPAMNVALCAAIETLKLKPIVIASAASSQYGANLPNFLWLDMERLLHDKGLISFRSKAASIGGYEDRGLGMSASSRAWVRDVIARNGLELLEADSYAASLAQRMEIYRQQAGDQPIKAYINVGGGTVSTGRALGRKLFAPGLNTALPPQAERVDSVMTRFVRQGVPVVHLVEITSLARQYGFPLPPESPPEIGSGSIYAQHAYNRWLAGVVLAMIVAAVRFCVRNEQQARIAEPCAGQLLPASPAAETPPLVPRRQESRVPHKLPAIWEQQPAELVVS